MAGEIRGLSHPEPLLELWCEAGSGGAEAPIDLAGSPFPGTLAGLTSRLKLWARGRRGIGFLALKAISMNATVVLKT